MAHLLGIDIGTTNKIIIFQKMEILLKKGHFPPRL